MPSVDDHKASFHAANHLVRVAVKHRGFVAVDVKNGLTGEPIGIAIAATGAMAETLRRIAAEASANKVDFAHVASILSARLSPQYPKE